jgi:hypothetical protein
MCCPLYASIFLHLWHPIKVLNPLFVNFSMTPLPTWTIQSMHNVGIVLVLGFNLHFVPSPPMKVIVLYFWQMFWTNPSTISPSHATHKFRGKNLPSMGKLLIFDQVKSNTS